MSSGTYFPPPVMAVEIPKSGGGTRILGVPAVADRVAQTVAAMALEARTESIFHEDSYGYRPRRGALDAVARCRLRCWKKDWVIDLDVQKFFDSVPWDLMVKAVEANITTGQKWVLLYVRRWLAAPLQLPGGTLAGAGPRELHRGQRCRPCWLTCSCTTRSTCGWPGSSRVWSSSAMRTTRSCTARPSGRPARCWRRSPSGWRRSGCGCTRPRPRSCTARTAGGVARTSTRRSRSWGTRSGPAGARRAGREDVHGLPARGQPDALKEMGQQVRPGGSTCAPGTTWTSSPSWINPVVAGWMDYYGRFYRSQLYPLLRRVNTYLMRWARQEVQAAARLQEGSCGGGPG